MTFPPSNQLAHQQDEQKAQPGKVFITRGSNPPMFGSTEVSRISTIETVQPINYNSLKRKEVRACYMLKSEFTKPALNSKLQSQSDHTHFTLCTVKRKRQNQTPMQTLSLINTSKQEITMTSGINENLQATNTKQTVVTHSHPTAKDQVRTISSDETYTIANVSFQSAPAQQPTNQPQELSSASQVLLLVDSRACIWVIN